MEAIDILRQSADTLQALAHGYTGKDPALVCCDLSDPLARRLAQGFAAEGLMPIPPKPPAGHEWLYSVAVPRLALARLLARCGYDKIAPRVRDRRMTGAVWVACWANGECFATDMEIAPPSTTAKGGDA